jgi:hypothetical protein
LRISGTGYTITRGRPQYNEEEKTAGTQVKIDELSINRHLGLRFPHGMTTEIIRTWSSGLKKHDQEKSVGDTSRFPEESNRLCRPVAMDFVSS